ncbi:LysR family transcriptional regulator [Paracoccus sp. TK19116]|uniref:LysR family transcriptional regulator n=1 Tax=Paracoccus albicereus TaxID=2922394 RepID=A0ABT1MPY4_9RHOB|nr:LysR family transcriptional regulator [Paracoccus albicereus]MCQ0969769.1 LysR family transcriptional regulator [Paracoccus albicereus]
MTFRNLRHLRVCLAAADTGSITRAAEQGLVSQPAVTQAIAGLEIQAGGPIFERSPQGLFVTERGDLLLRRARRALALIDGALSDISPRAARIVSASQLQALIAVAEAENFSLAARRLGLSQPTVHRAVAQIEREADRKLFQRTSHGVVPTPACQAITRAAQLALAELTQAEADLADFDGREVGRIVIGALPLSRSVLLPRALAAFRRLRPTLPVTVIDGRYDDMLASLRRGDIDLMVGALRDPAPIGDVVQERLFDDRLVILSRPDHPLQEEVPPDLNALATWPWAVPARGTPTRAQIDTVFAAMPDEGPASIIETGSLLLMRGLLSQGDFLACLSRVQAAAEIESGAVAPLRVAIDWPARPIGLTVRQDWLPTRAQVQLVQALRALPDPAIIPDGSP